MSGPSRQRGNERGPTAATVAENIKRVRSLRRMTQEDLSRRLESLGRRIPPASVGKIELGLRAVEVDDLVAIAVALDVTPLGLLLPVEIDLEDPEVEITGATVNPATLWFWAMGSAPISGNDWRAFQSLGFPSWLSLPPGDGASRSDDHGPRADG